MFLCTHHEERAEVGQVSEEVLGAEGVWVKGVEAAQVLVELLHVLVHGGELLVLLPRMLAEAVQAGRGQESRRKTTTTLLLQHVCEPHTHTHTHYFYIVTLQYLTFASNM